MKPTLRTTIVLLMLFPATAGAYDCQEDREYIDHIDQNIAQMQAEIPRQDELYRLHSYWLNRIQQIIAAQRCPPRGTPAPGVRCERLWRIKDDASNAQYDAHGRKQYLERKINDLRQARHEGEQAYNACLAMSGFRRQRNECRPGTSFQHFPHQAISGNNAAALPGVSAQTCLQACLDQAECRSVDYGPKSKTCYLSYKNSSNIGEPGVYFVGRPRGQPNWPFDYYERTCF